MEPEGSEGSSGRAAPSILQLHWAVDIGHHCPCLETLLSQSLTQGQWM